MATEIRGKQIDIDEYVDVEPLFDVVTKNSCTFENRLQIDIYAFKKIYENVQITILNYIPRTPNALDGL